MDADRPDKSASKVEDRRPAKWIERRFGEWRRNVAATWAVVTSFAGDANRRDAGEPIKLVGCTMTRVDFAAIA